MKSGLSYESRSSLNLRLSLLTPLQASLFLLSFTLPCLTQTPTDNSDPRLEPRQTPGSSCMWSRSNPRT